MDGVSQMDSGIGEPPRCETAGRDSELCSTKHHHVHATFWGTAGAGGPLNPLGHCCPCAIPGSGHEYSHQSPSPQVREVGPRRQSWSRSGFRGTPTAGSPVSPASASFSPTWGRSPRSAPRPLPGSPVAGAAGGIGCSFSPACRVWLQRERRRRKKRSLRW